jgi:hypothetical protein
MQQENRTMKLDYIDCVIGINHTFLSFYFLLFYFAATPLLCFSCSFYKDAAPNGAILITILVL